MAVKRVSATLARTQELPYTTFLNSTIELIKNPDALAVYTYLQTKAEHWIVRREDVMNRFSIGKHRYTEAMSHLRQLGLVERAVTRDSAGKVTDNQLIIHYAPNDLSSGLRVIGNPDELDSGESGHLETDQSFKNKSMDSNNTIGTSADAPCGVCGGDGFEVKAGLDMLDCGFIKHRCRNCNGTGKEPTCNDGLQVQDYRNSRTTEQPVCWSKAPAGAGFFCVEYSMFTGDPEDFCEVVGESNLNFIVRPDKPAVNSKLTTEKPKSAYPEEFEWIWKNKPERSGSNGKKSAYNACKARIKQGATWRELAEGVQRYAAHCKADGKLNTPYVMQMATFFGPDEHYKNQWSASAPVKFGAPCPTSAPLVPLASEMTDEQREASRARIKAMMKD